MIAEPGGLASSTATMTARSGYLFILQRAHAKTGGGVLHVSHTRTVDPCTQTQQWVRGAGAWLPTIVVPQCSSGDLDVGVEVGFEVGQGRTVDLLAQHGTHHGHDQFWQHVAELQ